MNFFSELVSPNFYIPVSAGVISYVIILFLKNVLFSRLKKLAQLTSIKLDDIIVDALFETRQIFIIATACYIGYYFTDHRVSQSLFFDRVFIIILMYQFWVWGNEIIRGWIKYTVSEKVNDPSVKTTLNFVGILLNMALLSVIVLSTLSNFGHDVSTIVAGLGIGGVAIALATKSLLEDLFSSLSIVLDKPFLVGDYISIGEWEGIVEYIGLKTTQIRSINGELILVSNSQMLASKIRNFKRLNERRVCFKLDVEIADIKISDVADVVKTALNSFKNVKFERANLISFTQSTATFDMVYWVETSKFKTYTQIHHDVLQKIHYEFTNLNVKISASSKV